jgi:hypothetical protein
MKIVSKKLVLMTVLAVLGVFPAKGQFVTIDPAHIATSIANTANQIVQTSATVSNVIRNFQEVQKVYNQGKEYYDALKSVHNLVQDARKVRDAILLVGEIGDIYVNSFQRMLNDRNFSFEELTAISNGYTFLILQSVDLLQEIRDVVNITGLSMTDAERMNIIDTVYGKLLRHRNLVQYYTRRNIQASYIRASRSNDTQRFLELYGNPEDRYW